MIWALVGLAGCYLSHERADPADGGPRRDAEVRRDAGPRLDAGPVECHDLRVSGTVELGAPEESSVTPRLVALPGGDVGVVYVEHGGSPTRVVYERLDRDLVRVTGRVVVTEESWTWGEPVVIDDTVVVAYGLPDDRSALLHLSFDGIARGPARPIPLPHPSLLRPSPGGMLWAAFVMRDTNSLLLAHVSLEGEVFRGPFGIETGRYGSGHGAVALPDEAGHVLGYPREGPPGVRAGYVAAISTSGGPEERPLGTGDARSVLPVWVGGRLVAARLGDELVIHTLDPRTLETLDTRTFPAELVESFPIAGSAADRLVLSNAVSGELRVHHFEAPFEGAASLRIPMPGTLGTGPTGIASYPDAVIIAVGLNEAAARSFPWLVRLECVP